LARISTPNALKAKHPVHPIVVLDYRVRLPGMLFIASFAVLPSG
jgi:hypothetical protein